MSFLTNLINGLSLGSVYAIIALGYTMVYGIAKMLNFAHGDVIMIGGYVCFCSVMYLGLGTLPSILIAVVACTLLGILVERLAYKPLRQAPSLAVLITAIGVSYFLQNAALLIWGSASKVFPSLLDSIPSLKLFDGDLSISGKVLVNILVCLITMTALTLFTGKTRVGKAMRAVSEDMDAARLMGINVNSTISFTFAVGSALAGIGSVLYCCSYPQATPTMGSMLGLKAFVAAVLGGIGSIPGAMVGGIAIGLCECFVSAIGLSAWKDAVTFAILIIVLLVKPTGFLGRKVQEKV